MLRSVIVFVLVCAKVANSRTTAQRSQRAGSHLPPMPRSKSILRVYDADSETQLVNLYSHSGAAVSLIPLTLVGLLFNLFTTSWRNSDTLNVTDVALFSFVRPPSIPFLVSSHGVFASHLICKRRRPGRDTRREDATTKLDFCAFVAAVLKRRQLNMTCGTAASAVHCFVALCLLEVHSKGLEDPP